MGLMRRNAPAETGAGEPSASWFDRIEQFGNAALDCGIAGCGLARLFGQCHKVSGMEGGSKAFEPHGRHFPVAVAPGTAQQIKLAARALHECRAQFAEQRRIIASRRSQVSIDRIAKISHGHANIRKQVKLPLSHPPNCVRHSDMAGGRKIIAIEGMAESESADDQSAAETVRLGKLLAADPGLDEAGSALPLPGSDSFGERGAQSGWQIGTASASESWPESWPEAHDEDTDPLPTIRREWLGLIVSGLLIAGWSAAFAVGNLAVLTSAQPLTVWTGLVSGWSTPVLVVLVALLVMRRNSRREAARFGDTARLLSHESERLERRLAAMNTELSLARDFIAAQSRDLESLGRIAVERIGGSADQLQSLVAGNGAEVERIGQVSDHALVNMEKLRGQLPVIANAAKDVTNTIANAGRTAHGQLEELASGLRRLNEFGLASERQVAQVRERVETAMVLFEAAAARIAEDSRTQFTALEENAEAHRQRLDQEEIAALAAIRARAETLHEELANQRASIVAAEEDTLAALGARFAAMRAESGAFSRTLTAAEDTALRQFADRSDLQLTALRTALGALTGDHEALIRASRERLAAFEQSAADLTLRLAEDATALDEELGRRRASLDVTAAEQRAALSQSLSELDTAIAVRRSAMASAGAEAADALARKLADLDTAVEAQRQRQLEEARLLGNHCDAIAERVAAFTATLRISGEQSDATTDAVDRALAKVNQRLIDMREALAGTDGHIDTLSDSAVRLLELIQAGSEHASTRLPEALGTAEAGLGGFENRINDLRSTLGNATENGRALSQHVETTRTDLKAAMAEMARLQKTFVGHASEQQTRLDQLRGLLASAQQESEALTQEIDSRMSGAIASLTDAAGRVGEDLRGGATREIEALAEKLGEESNAAIVRVLQGRGAELIARLEDAIDNAASASRETAIQMRDQLAKVDELAGNLENRVTRARERAEEDVDNDFARRTALITESLNSTSIDIAKVLSADVSETAWASYLRGDRGIFTRRAVSLLDNTEVRAVQQHYEADAEFRGHVNRYIHDFESMLRQLLSTRDGHALGVTLLSSDMGKLYVALAQGIERLRT